MLDLRFYAFCKNNLFYGEFSEIENHSFDKNAEIRIQIYTIKTSLSNKYFEALKRLGDSARSFIQLL